jgi:NADH-quinone oxidoreductase subunit M
MTLYDLILAAPFIGFVIVLLLPRSNDELIKRATIGISLLIFIASLGLIGPVLAKPAEMSFVTDVMWVPSPKITYHVGLDGLSLWLVILSTLLTPIAALISWKYIEHRTKEFYAFLLLLEFGLVGVFGALDLFLFYVFWEVALVPMYFLVGIWGHERRIYAAVKFFLYTMAGSVLMLAAIIFLYIKADSFDYGTILTAMQSGAISLSHTEATLCFLAFFLAFAIKVPLFPLHTWLPDAHVEAPTAGSVMLASVMLKMGTYGLVRFCLPLFPNAAREHAPWIVALAIIGIIYGALVALVQPNMKKLVAYSSVSHLGFVVLGIFSFNQMGLDGAVYQMLNHGISTGALFMLVGYLYERRHSLMIADYGGVATLAPALSSIFLVTTLASIGLPTLNNFIGEYLVLQGAALVNFQWAVFAAVGVILSACYMLWMYQRTFLGRYPGQPVESGHGHGGHGHDDHASHGDAHAATHGLAKGGVTHEEKSDSAEVHAAAVHDAHGHGGHGFHIPDLTLREWVAIMPLLILMVWMGMQSQTFLPSIGASNSKTLAVVERRSEQQVKQVQPKPAKQTQEVERAD